jgi:hypothetical protein
MVSLRADSVLNIDRKKSSLKFSLAGFVRRKVRMPKKCRGVIDSEAPWPWNSEPNFNVAMAGLLLERDVLAVIICLRGE